MPKQPADYELAPDGSCPRCGQRHVRVAAGVEKRTCAGHSWYDRDSDGGSTKRDTPRPCTQYPAPGFDRCGSHGVTRKQREAAKQRAQEERERKRMEQLAATLGEPIEADPAEIVTQRIAAWNGHVQWLLARVRDLEPEQLAWGLTRRKTAVGVGRSSDEQDDETPRRRFAGTDEGDTFEAKPSIWYALYREAADKLERLCLEAIRAGLEERKVRLAEQQGAALVRFIDGVLADLGHDPNNPETAQVVARHLQAVA